MSKCTNCNIKFSGNISFCPLCNNELVGKKSENVFPSIKEKKESLLNKFLLFITIAISIIFSFVEYMVSKRLTISKYVVFGLITNYTFIQFILKNHHNILKMLNKYFTLLMLILFMWFFVTKSLIITSYIIPILCMVIFTFNSVTLIILKEKYLYRYSKLIINNLIIGLIPLFIVLLKLTSIPVLSYVSVMLNLLIILALIIFFKDSIIEEIKKTFNV